MKLPKKPWSQSSDDVLGELEVAAERGLSSKEAKQRRDEFGANVLQTARPKSAWRILYSQFESLVVLLLLGAAVAAFAFGEYVEGVAIGVVILINTAIGFFMELRAVRSMEALRKMAQSSSRVRRDGEERMFEAAQLVPGDIVELQAGDVVSADMRIVRSQNLQVNESVLTGESVPAEKQDAPIKADAVLGDRTNMLFKGTAITRGDAEAVVTATGMATELGRITELVQHAQQHDTPLEARIDTLARKLVWVCLVLAGLIALIGFVQQKPTLQVIETAIALAVATIPEGLPIVATIALARGMWRMSRRNALVRNLAAVETLGSTSIVLTDKTGTLTENRMTVDGYVTPDGAPKASFSQGVASFSQESEPVDVEQNPTLKAALEIGMLCNGAEHANEADPSSPLVGDPVEIGLLQVATAAGFDRQTLRQAYPEVREESFDASVKMMGTFHQLADDFRVAVKGAPEAVLRSCTQAMTPDVFPALALGLGEGERGILERPPRDPEEPVLTREHWLRIFGWGSVITVVVLGVYALALYRLDLGPEMAVTMSFLTLALAQLWHVFNMRGTGAGRVKNDITKNGWVWGALAVCIVLTLIAVYVPPLAQVLDVVPPTLEQWEIVVAASLVPAVVGLIRK